MKRKSINISHLTPFHWIIWFVVAIVIVGSIYVFFHSFDHWKVTNGQFGDLLSGTVGVGASIGAMLFIIVTLVEQRKMNMQIEVHHLVESYNTVFDRLIHLLNSNSEVKEDSSIKVKMHLENLWFEDNGIQSTLHRITKRLREKTKDDVIVLQNRCKDEDLIRVSRILNRLLSIKCKIAELDTEAVKRVDDDWESIPQIWKEYAGFYFSWISSDDFKKSKNELHHNEMVKLFSERNDEKLFDFIPQIIIQKQEEIFKLSEEEFANQHIQIDSKCTFDLKIVNITFSGYSGYDYVAPSRLMPVDIVLKPRSSNKFSFKELLGNNVVIAFQHIRGIPLTEDKNSFLYQDIYINYIGKEWIYENRLEFNVYPNDDASILFQEITE